jgi:hypothetical protein
MLVIVGMILLLTWIFDHALHLTPSSLVNLLLLFASISLVLDFMRERMNVVQDPRPGWDARPPKNWVGATVRWFRHRVESGAARISAVPSKPVTAAGDHSRAA